MKRRLISLFIATAAILTACCGVFYAQSSNPKPANTEIYVNDNFVFSKKAAIEHLELCDIAGYPVSLNARLENSGYENIEYYDYENSLKSDNKVGLVLCKKENALLAIMRGTKDEEWYSNFNIGNGFEHAGFSIAADKVLLNILSYMQNHSMSKSATEVYLTGHSRGAAVANITASRLIDENTFKSVSAYTFACPNTTTSVNANQSRYKSIINIINPQDFICYIPLESWEYTRYGKTVELPKSSTVSDFDTLYSNMKEAYVSDTSNDLKDFPNKSKDVEDIIGYLSTLAPSVEDYYEKEIFVAGLRLTTYDYMMKLAAVMNNENPLLHGLFMLSCKAIPEVSAITEFVFSGVSESKLMDADSMMNTAVVVNHLPAAYSAWINSLDEDYFLSRLK